MARPGFPKQVSQHGQRLYLTHDDELVAKGAFVAGGERSIGRQGGNIVLPGAPGIVAQFDDFVGDLVGDEWNYAEGDTGNSGGIAAATNGVYRLTISATAATAPTGYAALNGGLLPQWKAKQGGLRMSARVKISALNGGNNVFVGFTDTGAGEMPIYDTGGGIISTATNAVGFVYGGAASAASGWTGVGVNADTDGTSVAGDAPTANTYDVLEVALGDTGTGSDGDVAYFYQNGVLKGSMSSPVLATRALVPVVAAFAKDTGGWTVDIDYLNPSANRDTGD